MDSYFFNKKGEKLCYVLFLFISIYFYLFLFISIIISFESCELNNPSNTNINTNTQGLSTQLLLSDMIEVKNLTSVPDTIRMQAIKCVPEEYL